MNVDTTFRIGSGAALGSIAAACFGFARIQQGPLWEVPVAASGRFFEATVIAIALCAIAVWSYIQLRPVRCSLRWIFGTTGRCEPNDNYFKFYLRPRPVANYPTSPIDNFATATHSSGRVLCSRLVAEPVCKSAQPPQMRLSPHATAGSQSGPPDHSAPSPAS
jgi:hypothetical protein